MSIKHSSGFTLIELLVVIGIIGILSGVLLAQFTGASESAMAAKCMTNMRNLAVAAYSYASSQTTDGVYPAAGSYEYIPNSGTTRHERLGWVSWLNESRPNPYSSKPKRHVSSGSWTPYLAYTAGNKSERDHHRFALTNGCLWAYCGRNSETYVCPKHVKACKAEQLVPAWSYVMNSLFGYDRTRGSSSTAGTWQRISRIYSTAGGGVTLAPDRVLLFAEVPFTKIESNLGSVQNSVTLQGSSPEFDCTLQYDDATSSHTGWSGTKESIGFNHKKARNYVAHVAFADGHVSSLILPRDMGETEVRSLTDWLCQGDEIYFSGKAYERVNKADKKEK